MAVGAQNPATISIIEQHEIANDFVLIWSNARAEDTQRSITLALRQVSQYLVVGAIFLNDVNDVLDGAGFADAFGHRTRRLARANRREGFGEAVAAIVLINQSRQSRQVAFFRKRYERNRAKVRMRIEP